MSILFPKCFFYTPGTNSKNIFIAQDLFADVAVLDLEDSVPSIEKNNARINLKTFLENKNFKPLKAVRINSIRTQHGINDIHYILNLDNHPDIIIMTMVYEAEEVSILQDILANLPSKIKIYVTIETGLSMENISQISAVSDGLIFGSADYAALLCVDISWENMLYARNKIVMTAATYNIPAIDTACYCLNPIDILINECKQVRSLGFTGKAAVHPSQVSIINTHFSASESELSNAKEIIAAFDKNHKRIINMDGQMIGPPFIAKARKLINRHS